jgi:hypothetical protein
VIFLPIFLCLCRAGAHRNARTLIIDHLVSETLQVRLIINTRLPFAHNPHCFLHTLLIGTCPFFVNGSHVRVRRNSLSVQCQWHHRFRGGDDFPHDF